ncbi:E3 ubiquitin/ISG15 ligase TRIM25-like [Mantella aurantiaca]
MASADLRDELECSLCLNIYTDPVLLKCGHNFCRVCIDRVLDTQGGSGGYSCPECREKFQDRPALQINRKLRNIAENFLSAQTSQDQSGVFCTYCVDSPVPAVRSCLLCEVSLCDKHLRVHKKSPEHILTDPTSSLESRKCSVHKKILEYYCTEDDICVCMSCCMIGGHKGHEMESLDEASGKKKETLRNVLQKLVTTREKTEERVRSLQEHRRKVDEEAAGDTERVTALFIDLRRRLEVLEKRVLREISGRAERDSMSIEEKIRDLAIKKDELSRKMRHIEELCNMTDPLTVLQESDTGDLCDTENGDDESDTDPLHATEDEDDEESDTGDSYDTENGDNEESDTGDLCDTENGDNEESDTGDLCDTENGDNEESDTGDLFDSYDNENGDNEESDTGDAYDTENGDNEESDTGDAYDTENGDNEESDTGDSYDTDTGDDEESDTGDDEESDTGDLCDTEDGDDEDRERHDKLLHDGGGLDVAGILHTGLSDIITDVNVYFYMQKAADILLDVSTADNYLHISDDKKTASWSDINQNCPETPERFLGYPQVLNSQSFSSGRHYWEVDVGGSGGWRVGMCYPSIDRRGVQSWIGDNKKSWGLARYSNRYRVIHDSNEILLPANISSNRIRIYLDYEAGRISFYDLCDPIRHLHNFTTTFTEPLHAGIFVWEGFIKICGGNWVI